MQNPGLDQSAFIALGAPTTNAFLAVTDAISEIATRYGTEGLFGAEQASDPQGHPDEPPVWIASDRRRVARPVVLPEGTRLFKLTAWKTSLDKDESGAWKRPTLSSWWSPVGTFEESEMTAAEVFETAILNQVTMRDYVRFASAVSLDWNPLTYYTEVTIADDVGAFWGQFSPQRDLAGTVPEGMKVVEVDSPSGPDDMVIYQASGDEVYVPPILGGTGAWQLFVPDFSNDWIDAQAVVNLSSTGTDALAAHFGISVERIAELREAGRAARR
jgi:hypothetical protein